MRKKRSTRRKKRSARRIIDAAHVKLSKDQANWALQYNENIRKMIEAVADKKVVRNGQFVFFAAFDGTNNDMNELKGNFQSTNVGQLWDQYLEKMNEKKRADPSLHGNYYAGLGTENKPWTETWAPAAVTKGVIKIAEKAYDDFAKAAAEWLKKNKQPVTVVVTAFSRGAASAVIFSQLLCKNRLVGDSGKVLLNPDEAKVSAGVLFDPVLTGVKGNMAFPSNVKNVVAIKALSEFRTMFRAVDYSQQRDIVKTFGMYGNHCDIGGGYDNGLSAVSLEAATRFLQKLGLPIKNVPPERRLDRKKIRIHKEETDKDDAEIWSADQDWFSFETDVRQSDRDVLIKRASKTAAGRQSFTLYDGKRIFIPPLTR